MPKAHNKLTFLFSEGQFRNMVSGDSETLADWLTRMQLIMDDNTEFARIRYNDHLSIWYRVINAYKITIDLWEH